MNRYGIIALADWQDPSLAVNDGLETIISNTNDTSEDLVIVEVVRIVRAPSALATVEMPDWKVSFAALDLVSYYDTMTKLWLDGVVDKVLAGGSCWVRNSANDGVFFCDSDQIKRRTYATPAPYKVGDEVEALGWRHSDDNGDKEYRRAKVEMIDAGAFLPIKCEFLEGPQKGNHAWRKTSEVRRPVTPRKFEPVVGARVRTVGAQSDDEQREGAIVCVAPPYVWVELSSGPHKNLAVRRIASQVRPI